jgi:predicted RND superfamily exporter protein
MSEIQRRMPTGTFKSVLDEDIDNLLTAATTETPARKRLKTSEVQVVRQTQPPTPPALRPITEAMHAYGEQLAEHQRAMYAALNLLAHRLHATEQNVLASVQANEGQVREVVEAVRQGNQLIEQNNHLQAHVYQQQQGTAKSFNEMTEHLREASGLNKRVLQSKITRTVKRIYKDPSQTAIGGAFGVLISLAAFAIFQLVTH